MNDLQIFDNPEFGRIRAVEIDGEPWFCLADVCKPLGLQARKCRERLKTDGILSRDAVDSTGRRNKMLWCNEGNLYRAIFQSKKPEAERFTDWVTEEVLPALRKHGTYTVPGVAPAVPITAPPEVSPGGLARLITVTRKIMIDAGSTPRDICKMEKDFLQTWNVSVPIALEWQTSGQISLFDSPALEAPV